MSALVAETGAPAQEVPIPGCGMRALVGCDLEITPCGDNAPALVRGATGIRDDQGVVHAVTRPVVGVCTCGKTQRGPWCDGTHKFVRR